MGLIAGIGVALMVAADAVFEGVVADGTSVAVRMLPCSAN